MKVALAQKLTGIDSVELGELPDPAPAAGQVLIRVHGAGVGPWDVGFLGGGFPGIAETSVYGVQIPGHDGRAGMAAVVANGGLDLKALHAHLAQRLPDYARPLFLRIRRELDMTTTFKQRKLDLVKQGFEPGVTGDPVFFDDPGIGTFVRLDRPLYDRIRGGQVRL